MQGHAAFHWLKLPRTRLPLALSSVLVWGGGAGIGIQHLVVTGTFLFLSPLGSGSNLSCLKLFCNSFSHAPQARRELRRLKEEARNKHAIAVIWAYWLGSKVPDAHIPSLHPAVLQESVLISSAIGGE